MSTSVEVGGEIRRVAILTVRRGPCACYLARRLRPAGVELTLVSQRRLRVEPDSPEYFRRLLRRRGILVFADYLLLHGVKSAARLGRGVPRAPERSGDDLGGGALLEDSHIAREEWLTHLEVDDVNRPPDQDRLRELRPDVILLAGAPVLAQKTIEIARVACINPHCGITPDYAGSSPFDWAIFEKRFQDVGFTIHLVVPRVDSGPVLHQERISWDPSRSNGHLWPILAQRMYDKLAEVTVDLVRGRCYTAVHQGPTRVMPPAGLVVRVISELRRRRYARHAFNATA